MESAIENLLLGHVTFSCALNGIVELSGFLQFSFVSVNPIMVGCSRAAFAKRSLRSMGFVGRPLMFCRIIRSWVGGRGMIGVGPHVMFVLGRFSVDSCWVGGGSISVWVVLLLLLLVVIGVRGVVVLVLFVSSVVALCVLFVSFVCISCCIGVGYSFVIYVVVVGIGAIVVVISVVVVADIVAVVGFMASSVVLFHGFVVVMIVFVAVLYNVIAVVLFRVGVGV